MSSPRAWFVTDACIGVGRAIAEHALQQGDHVVATLRKPDALSDLLQTYSTQLLILSLDVTKPEQIHAAFETALERFGRIDVVLNHTETGIVSEAEGMTDQHGRRLFEELLWGTLNVTKEAVMTFRERNDPPGGRLLQVSSQTASKVPPGVAHYAAAKTALECLSEGLMAELDPKWNINISVIQPSFLQTNPTWINNMNCVHEAYGDPHLPSRRIREELATRRVDGDAPKKFARAVYRLARMDDPPLYLPLHRDAVQAVKEKGESFIRAAEEYASWSDDVYFSQS